MPKSISTLPCLVRFRSGPTVHEVEIYAQSVMEAAAAGYRELKADLLAGLPEDAIAIEVAVQRPPVIHRVSLDSLRNWPKGATPRETTDRTAIRELLKNR